MTLYEFNEMDEMKEKEICGQFNIEYVIINEIGEYSTQNLTRKIEAIQNSLGNIELPELTIYEKENSI